MLFEHQLKHHFSHHGILSGRVLRGTPDQGNVLVSFALGLAVFGHDLCAMEMMEE